jgi:hypothetical protein
MDIDSNGVINEAKTIISYPYGSYAGLARLCIIGDDNDGISTEFYALN